MKNPRSSQAAHWRPFVLLTFVFCIAAPLWAAGPQKVADVQIIPGQVTWRTHVDAEGWTVTISGQGIYLRERYEEMTVIANTGDMSVRGTLTTGGPTCGGGCDELFSPAGEVESIEEHAASMWENSHLPAVGPTSPGQPMNVSEKVGGLINELEKAHIYIERLNEQAKDKDQRIGELEQRLTRLEAFLGAQTGREIASNEIRP